MYTLLQLVINSLRSFSRHTYSITSDNVPLTYRRPVTRSFEWYILWWKWGIISKNMRSVIQSLDRKGTANSLSWSVAKHHSVVLDLVSYHPISAQSVMIIHTQSVITLFILYITQSISRVSHLPPTPLFRFPAIVIHRSHILFLPDIIFVPAPVIFTPYPTYFFTH